MRGNPLHPTEIASVLPYLAMTRRVCHCERSVAIFIVPHRDCFGTVVPRNDKRELRQGGCHSEPQTKNLTFAQDIPK